MNKNWFCMHFHWIIDNKMTSFGNIRKTTNFAWFYLEYAICCTSLNPISCYTFENEQKTGSTLILIWYNLGHNRHHNVQFWKHMKNCQFGMILQRVHYHVEIPFPVLHRKRNSHNGSKPVHLIPVIFVSCLLTFECVGHFLICGVPLYSHLYLFRMCLSINS